MLNRKNINFLLSFALLASIKTQGMDPAAPLVNQKLPLIELQARLKFHTPDNDGNATLVLADNGVREETNSALGRKIVKEGDVCVPMFLHVQKRPDQPIAGNDWVRKPSPQDNSIDWSAEYQAPVIISPIKEFIASNNAYDSFTKLSLIGEVLRSHRKPFPIVAIPLYVLRSRNYKPLKVNNGDLYSLNIMLPPHGEIEKNSTKFSENSVHIMSQVSENNVRPFVCFFNNYTSDWPQQDYSFIKDVLKSLHKNELIKGIEYEGRKEEQISAIELSLRELVKEQKTLVFNYNQIAEKLKDECLEKDTYESFKKEHDELQKKIKSIEVAIDDKYTTMFDEIDTSELVGLFEPLRFMRSKIIFGSQWFNYVDSDNPARRSYLVDFKEKTDKTPHSNIKSNNIVNYILKSQHI